MRMISCIQNILRTVTLNCIRDINVVQYAAKFFRRFSIEAELSNDSFPILRVIVRDNQGRSTNLHLRLNHGVDSWQME